MKRGDVEASLRAIVNPAKLDRDRQLETCMQCHLESTSTPLPFQIRAIRAHLRFRTRREDAERLLHPFRSRARSTGARRQVRDRRRRVPPAQVGVLSAQRDDVRDVSRPARHRARRQGRGALCRDLRELPQDPASAWRPAGGGRRSRRHVHRLPHAEAASGRRGSRRHDGPLHPAPAAEPGFACGANEADSLKDGDYRGDVVLYYPPTTAATPENELYLALAQVRQGSNLTAASAGSNRRSEAPARTAGVLLRAWARVLDERRS
jgi:hypothetical protein